MHSRCRHPPYVAVVYWQCVAKHSDIIIPHRQQQTTEPPHTFHPHQPHLPRRLDGSRAPPQAELYSQRELYPHVTGPTLDYASRLAG